MNTKNSIPVSKNIEFDNGRIRLDKDVERNWDVISNSDTSQGLSEESFDDILRDCEMQIATVKREMASNCDEVCDTAMNALLRIRINYGLLKIADVVRARGYHQQVGLELVNSGVARSLCVVVIKFLNKGWVSLDGKVDVSAYEQGDTFLSILHNYTDSSKELAIELSNVESFLETVMKQLNDLYTTSVIQKKPLHLTQEDFVETALGLLHNCANVEENKIRLRGLGLSALFFSFMNNSEVEDERLIATLGLANILTEEESKQMVVNPTGIKFLLSTLDSAVADGWFRYQGYSAKDLAYGVQKLALNDNNKKLLVDNGVLPMLNKMMRLTGLDEQRAAVEALFVLSFAEENKERVVLENGMIQILYDLMNAESPDPVLRRNAERTLWNLREKLCRDKTFACVGSDFIAMEGDLKKRTDVHVMISYSWKNQKVLLDVRDTLQRKGYKTWMDVDNMEGSTLQAMAEAVEKSAAILVCLSQSYKDSEFCRLEFEYAFKCKKMMVPLLMEAKYKPDGWLGLVINNKLYYDLSGKYSFKSKMDSVVKALGDRGKMNIGSDIVDASFPETVIVSAAQSKLTGEPTRYRTPPQHTRHAAITAWSKEELNRWLFQNNLSRNESLYQLDGEQLVFLWKLKLESPDVFYLLLISQLKLNKLLDLMKFTKALKSLLE